MKPALICSAVRTAIGGFGGALAEVSPVDLGALVTRDALRQAGLDDPQGAPVNEVIIGNVLGAGHGMNLARQICLKSGLGVSTSAYTVNKVCGSGLKAITLGATEIAIGGADCVVAGGTESMSQAAFVSLSTRWGSRLGNAELKDLILADGLTDAFHSCHMGITAENLAEKYEISREHQDQFALESQSKAQAALEQGHFKSEITPVPLFKRGKEIGRFEVDEHPRKGTTLETLSALRPAFKKDGTKAGTVTAGNASGINDGAAAVVLASEGFATRHNLKPIAEIVAWASGAVEPAVMGIGPVEAVKKLMQRTSIPLESVDLIEANEAFASQALAVNKLLGWDTQKVNVCGGAIALGHPIGASGARILVTLVHQLRRTNKKIGIATLCVGGGQGIAALVRLL
ncbi:MAG: acetyl-CoA C-acetyltransferase [Deltaproteobacteria bacterium]|nr:acetyl-CoA C-acetyltransferase [Deltaproteobacteria bacterium]